MLPCDAIVGAPPFGGSAAWVRAKDNVASEQQGSIAYIDVVMRRLVSLNDTKRSGLGTSACGGLNGTEWARKEICPDTEQQKSSNK
eukprot:SAG11_NODE_681_length_7772_cov_26.403362_10_plen_86_part_00